VGLKSGFWKGEWLLGLAVVVAFAAASLAVRAPFGG
jgi:hypothetical protein